LSDKVSTVTFLFGLLSGGEKARSVTTPLAETGRILKALFVKVGLAFDGRRPVRGSKLKIHPRALVMLGKEQLLLSDR
jgi:hypothetical protein